MITDDTLAALRANDTRQDNLFLYLDDYSYDQDGDDELTQALRGNTCVTAVDVDMHLEEMTNALGTLMTSIGHLQNLQRLRCSSSGDYAVTMAALAKTVAVTNTYTYTNTNTNNADDISSNAHPANKQHCTSQSLVSLDLSNFLLYDEQQDNLPLAVQSYQEFVDTLQNHPTLKSFNLGFGYMSRGHDSSSLPAEQHDSHKQGEEEDDKAHTSLTPLIRALTSMPNLDWIRLDGAGFAPREALTSQALASFCNNQTSDALSVLEIHDFDMSLCHIQDLAYALETNTSLKVLSLSCHEYYSENTMVEQQQRNTTIAPATDSNPNSPPPGALCVAQVLRMNTYLEKLFLPMVLLTGTYKRKETTDEEERTKEGTRTIRALLQIFSALRANHTLLELQLAAAPQKDDNEQHALSAMIASSEATPAFRSILQHNYGLQRLDIPYFVSEEWKAEIQLHMKLNTMGRGRLVRNTSMTRQQWIQVLTRVQDDVSCLFHMLLLNPLLCQSSTTIVSKNPGVQ